MWADNVDGIFYFPWSQIRFVEVPPDRTGPAPTEDGETEISLRPPADEADLEIDEAFLRRVRDV